MGLARIRDEQLRILSFWWMLELFSPQPLPALTKGGSPTPSHQVIAWQFGDPLPWEVLPPPTPFNGRHQAWRHTVYLGSYRLETLYKALEHVFGEDPDADDQRPLGKSACGGILLDQDGRLVTASAVLSSALWAVGRTRDPGPGNPHWMDGFGRALEEFGASVDALDIRRQSAKGAELTPPHDSDSLRQLLELAHGAAGVGGFDDLANDHVVIKSVRMPVQRATEDTNIDFLNSFYLDELAAVREEVAQGNLGAGLNLYLTPDSALPVDNRIDVIENPAAVTAATMVGDLPAGRWPANPRHALALSQQFAVNRALNDLSLGAGLMGVNGPPGTGKTTMLRDILAGNVVERARRLAALLQPSDAFVEITYPRSDDEGRPQAVRQLRPELKTLIDESAHRGSSRLRMQVG